MHNLSSLHCISLPERQCCVCNLKSDSFCHSSLVSATIAVSQLESPLMLHDVEDVVRTGICEMGYLLTLSETHSCGGVCQCVL